MDEMISCHLLTSLEGGWEVWWELEPTTSTCAATCSYICISIKFPVPSPTTKPPHLTWWTVVGLSKFRLLIVSAATKSGVYVDNMSVHPQQQKVCAKIVLYGQFFGSKTLGNSE